MFQIKNLADLDARLRSARGEAGGIGFVPTMGNLHDGHLSLVQHAKVQCGFTVVSIFVNPFQFGAGEDLDTYPRTLTADLEKLKRIGADAVFLPNVEDLYPNGPDNVTRIEVPGLGKRLCGVHRPDFFRGVCTVVNILLNLVQADAAYFGEKDYQQLLVIRRMVADLRMRTHIEVVPTMREQDGLAMSSRNGSLDATERSLAPDMYRILVETRDRLLAGETDIQKLEADGVAKLIAIGFKPDYLAVRRAVDLAEPGSDDKNFRVLGAAWLGTTRLIDNVAADATAISQ
jgi:pantoate--beta-alanine ligase